MSYKPFTSGSSHWVWVPGFDDRIAAQFVLFRKTVWLDEIPKQDVLLHVSADTRYRLYLNGNSISIGPCKSYPQRWNYEAVNITPHLSRGLNVLAARVLRFSSSHPGCFSMMRTPLPGFIIDCDLLSSLNTSESWKARLDASTRTADISEWDYRLGPSFLNLFERVDGNLVDNGYLGPEYDDSGWSNAVVMKAAGKMSPMLDPRRLTPRQIPVLTETFGRFDGVVKSDGSVDEWTALVRQDEPLTLPSGSDLSVDFEVKNLTTGYLDFVCDYNGTGDSPQVEFLCAECYETPFEEGQSRRKGDRSDFRNGVLYGPVDIYKVRSGSNYYSPFWFRTFRYLRLRVSTGLSPLTVKSFTFRSTHYPLRVATTIQTSSKLFTQLWDISLNTLVNCMHETYEDCPYYEQNQFSMDSRSQILFTYLLSWDDRLARKTMHEFYASRRDDGLLEAQFPNPGRCTNIPTFSLFWVLMVYDHMVHFGDERLVREYAGAVDGVLGYFDQRLTTKCLVGHFDDDCWAFVDWVDGWVEPGKGFLGLAVPPAYFQTGSATFHSLLYAYTLLKASELCIFIGRHDTGREYITRQRNIISAVKKYCFDQETGLFLDGPGVAQFSQHVQMFAVLSQCVEKNAAKDLMRKTVSQEHSMAKASFAMGFYLFRAASVAGVYEESWPVLIQPWEKMMAQNLTTWAESESSVRSDCHAWSATPLYEIAREVIGVKQYHKKYLERLKKSEVEIVVAPKRALVEDMTATVLVGGDATLNVAWEKGRDPVVSGAKDYNIQVHG